MKLANFRIKNFKCFSDTGEIVLSECMNIVCGQNNAGKTALLQALELRFLRAAHRSITSLPEKGELGPAPSEVQFTISLSGKELEQMARHRYPGLLLPSDLGVREPHPLGIPYNRNWQKTDPRNLELFWSWFTGLPEISFKLMRSSAANAQPTVSATVVPSHDLYRLPPDSGPYTYLLRQVQPDGSEIFVGQQRSTADLQDFGVSMFEEFQDRIYRFSAERFALGESPVGISETLAHDATNLPEVLSILQANATAHEEFVSLVREILPQIKWINVKPIENQRLRVNVWTIDKKHKRDDLAIPLTQSGTGIGQVLSILYVAYTSENSRVLLIDEPQSFLHPGAARKLIEVLKRFSQHQYVISTHSASIIAAAGSPEILILRSDEGKSRIETEDARDSQTMQSFLQEVGARLSDVFGMDRVIWVEGPTEEKALPLLLKKLKKPFVGTAIVSIRNTGDLDGKDKKRIFEIYNNLSGKASILPPVVAFVLDAESRSDYKKDEILKLSNGKAHFLPRRTFENYLIHPKAISAIINKIENFAETELIVMGDIDTYIAGALSNEKYWHPCITPQNPSLASPELNGALVLQNLFAALSEQRVTYNKTDHSVMLFQWLLDNDLNHLDELISFLTPIVDVVTAE